VDLHLQVAMHVWPDAPRHSNQVLRYLPNLTLDNALAMPLRRTAPGPTPGSAAPAPPHSS